MVIVDTTVWVDFFRNRSVPHVGTLKRSLDGNEDVCICGVILTEVLQGIRKDEDYRRTLSRFDALIFLPMNRAIFEEAASMYRLLRRKGVTIRKPVDCMIAAVATQNDIALLHNDRDFDLIEKHCGLRVAKTSQKS